MTMRHHGKYSAILRLVLAAGALSPALALDLLNENYTFTGTEPSQSSRVFRSGTPTSWATTLQPPDLVSGSFIYKSYTLTPGTAQYVQISLDDPTESLFAVAYIDGFSPNNPRSSWAGDLGLSGNISGNPGFFQVFVPASRTLTVVVHVIEQTPSQTFHLLVEGFGSTEFDPPFPSGADFSIKMSHGPFALGLPASWEISIKNNGSADSAGTVTVQDILPEGLSAVSMDGFAWTCNLANASCTTSDIFRPGQSSQPLTIRTNSIPGAPYTLTNRATVSGGGDISLRNNTAVDLAPVAHADLVIFKNHAGNFARGQIGARYNIAVINQGPGATFGPVVVQDNLPAGMTATSISGTGWSCVLATLRCETSAVFPPTGAPSASSFIELLVNVAANAPLSVTNVATVSGGAEVNTANNTASNITVIQAVGTPDLLLGYTYPTVVPAGQTTTTFDLLASNTGNAPTSGLVTVTWQPGMGWGATVSIGGAGWTCVLATRTCTRSDALANSAAYPPISIVANVSGSNVQSAGSISGGGETNTGNSSFVDFWFISYAFTRLEVTKSHVGNFVRGQMGVEYSIVVKNTGSGSSSGVVTVQDILPVNASLTAKSIQGAGWSCVLATVTCTRSDILPPNQSYPAITLRADVSLLAPAVVTNTARVSGGGSVYPFWTVDDLADVASLPDAPGVFRSSFFWLQDVNGDRAFSSPPDRAFAFGGVPGDIPISGDWNGTGRTKVGVYRPANGLFILDYDGDGQFTIADRAWNLGVGVESGDKPVVGDWNGDGKTKVGIFRQGFFWILDYNGNGVFEQGTDRTYAFGGVPGDVPVVGDWTREGVTKIGIFRLGFYWILDTNGNGRIDNVNNVENSGGDEGFAFGGIAGDIPLVGDWNHSGWSRVGIFRQGFFWVLDTNGNRSFDGTGTGQDAAFPFGGIAGDVPIAGKW